jgi:hypothetical protein
MEFLMSSPKPLSSASVSSTTPVPSHSGNYRLFQIVCGILGLIPVVTGLLTMMGLHNPEYHSAGIPMHVLLDSNLRFFGGVWLGIGLMWLWMLPRLRTEALLFRALSLAIFLGGVGRLISMLAVGLPPVPFIAFTALEIVGMPLLVFWQHSLRQDR